jgi:hypothetical protein
MAFISTNQTKLIYGTNSLAAILRTVSPSATVDMLDATTLNDTAKTFVPGLEDMTLNVDGLFDNTTTAGSAFANITAAISATSTVPTSVAPSGFAVTNPVWLLPAKTITYDVTSAVADLVQFSMSLGAATPPSLGVSLADLAVVSATGNGTSVDNAAGTTNGGIAHLHITAVSGTTPTLAVIVQHSTNNSTWTTLASFTSATAATSESITFSGTVNRYVRASYTAGGTSPQFTCQVSLARN